ncbi:hypothetical protein SASPL_118082 [Salvia splendens]|uniref:4-hydroxy-3-methylbut-2-enyl diphosphate reductase n=1 Tax=Salvia splendens TaxID=180675 RepID=A0A8X8ZYT4_SALSN|nr:hypothetical protein SASPL_118082 [Salvia splendens]
MAISLQLCQFNVPQFPAEKGLFPRPKPYVLRCSAAGEAAPLDGKEFRHNFMRRNDYNRRGFGHQDETLDRMNHEYAGGGIIKKLKENGKQQTWGEVTVKLAEAHGICWGVERAVRIAYEARKQFPTQNIWLNNEIIHNPTVNQVLVYFIFLFILFM